MNRILTTLFAGVIMGGFTSQTQGRPLSNMDVKTTSNAMTEKKEAKASGIRAAMVINITANGKTTVFRLNDSTAARELYAQLPLSISVEDYSHNEKIFYPPKKLNTSGTPKANATAGTLAYYAPWGDVVMFYKDFGSAPGLHELGQAVSGDEFIQGMSGTIRIENGNAP